MSEPQWEAVADKLPPEREVVLTKIHDANGTRNIRHLKRRGNLWFLPDGSMYVYDTPTHWAKPRPARGE